MILPVDNILNEFAMNSMEQQRQTPWELNPQHKLKARNGILADLEGHAPDYNDHACTQDACSECLATEIIRNRDAEWRACIRARFIPKN